VSVSGTYRSQARTLLRADEYLTRGGAP